MPAYRFLLDETFRELVDFKKFPVSYFNLEIQNFDGPELEFTFGDPTVASVALLVPFRSTTTRDNRALAGVLWGRAVGGSTTISLEIW